MVFTGRVVDFFDFPTTHGLKISVDTLHFVSFVKRHEYCLGQAKKVLLLRKLGSRPSRGPMYGRSCRKSSLDGAVNPRYGLSHWANKIGCMILHHVIYNSVNTCMCIYIYMVSYSYMILILSIIGDCHHRCGFTFKTDFRSTR